MNYPTVLDRWARTRFLTIPERAEVISVQGGRDGEMYVLMEVDGKIEATIPVRITTNDLTRELVNTALGIIE